MTKRAGRHQKSPQNRSKERAIATGTENVSHYWPELHPAAIEAANSVGRGEAVKRVSDMRLELRAIINGFPIPPDLKARLVYEASNIMLSSKSTIKEKAWSIKILKEMIDSNNRGNLPAQVTVNNTAITVQTLLRESSIDLLDNRLDFRPVVVDPGSEDDYAD